MLTLLIVDDSPDLRAGIKEAVSFLQLPPHRIHEASDGRAALAIVESEQIDIILLDLDMPVMGGRALLAELRKTNALSETAVIVVSGDLNESQIGRLRAEGAAALLRKPFTIEELRATIARIATP